MKKILVIGSLNMDFSIRTHKMPVPGETVMGESYITNPGGKGANQAFALGKLDSNVSMIGLVGNDTYGSSLINNLRGANVDTSGIDKLDNVNTGVAFVTVDDNGENNIVVISGANEKVNSQVIDKNIELIKSSDIIVMQLEIPIDVIIYVSKLAKEYGKFVILDPAPARKDLPETLFKNIDILKPNETELEILTNKKVETEEDVISASKYLLELGVKNVVVTLGGNGSVLVNNQVEKKFDSLDVDVVDTTAAGDSFTAALANYLSQDKTLEEAIEFAHVVSSMVVMKSGAQSSIPTLNEVNDFISRNGDLWKK